MKITDADLDLDSPPHAVPPAVLAAMLGVGVRRAREMVANGTVYGFKVGARKTLIPKAAIRRLLEAQNASDDHE